MFRRLFSLVLVLEARIRHSAIGPIPAATAYWAWHNGWRLFFWLRARIKGNAAYIAIGDHHFLYDMRDKSVGRVLYLFRQYEERGVAFLGAQLEPGMTFVDIGANTGCYTLLGSKLVGTKGTVVAFEPGPDNVELLRINVELNGLKNVEIIEKAVCDRPRKLLLHLSWVNPGDHRIYEGDDDQVYNAGRPRRTVPVCGTPLDAYFGAHPRRVDMIKMDIQGSEHQALRGMMNTLAANEGIILMTEYWPYGLESAESSPRAFIEDLLAQRFQLHLLGENGQLRPTNPSMLDMSITRHQHTTLICSRRELAK